MFSRFIKYLDYSVRSDYILSSLLCNRGDNFSVNITVYTL
nr:MAG TPA: hypothetical protein [Bacteriophage sp.]